MESPHLLIALAVALCAAVAGGIVATLLRQPTILGFVLAGVVIGPNTPFLVADITAVEELANIGLVLLMFAIGVHISLRDMREVGWVALAGGSAQMVSILGVGLAAGMLLGWGALEAAFFGAVLAISSGAVMSRLLSERGELGTVHGRIALSWSAVQDFGTIVLVVVLTAIAHGERDLAGDVAWAVGKAALFLALLLPIGSRLLPWLLRQVAALHSREVFVLVIACLALGTAWASTAFGLSLALGAFVAGVVVSESDLSHQVLGQVEPLRDIFAGLFFVSIGMFVDPGFILANLPLLLLAVTIIALVKSFIIALLVRAFGYPLRAAVLTGIALSQAGEFSFLLARLGGELEVVSGDVFNLMLAGSAVSILLTAPMLRSVDPLLHALRMHGVTGAPDPALRNAADRDLRNHAVLCGYGRVGRVIGEELIRRGEPLLVIEEDQTLVDDLRERGIPVLNGYADLPAVIEQARLDRARVLIVAIPDIEGSNRIIDYAREVNPLIEIVVRAHDIEEQAGYLERGATEALVGETELALEMLRFTLQRFGVRSIEIHGTLRRLRGQTSARERLPWVRRFAIPALSARPARQKNPG